MAVVGHWLLHLAGMDSQNTPFYMFWSGIGAAGAGWTAIGVAWWTLRIELQALKLETELLRRELERVSE